MFLPMPSTPVGVYEVSTAGEVWMKPHALADAVTHQHRANYWAHDQVRVRVRVP